MKAISGRELGRILEREGWQLLRVRVSHHLYGRGTERIVVPVHGNESLKTGLQRDLMEQAGLTDQERTVLRLIGEGLTNRQIGERMGLAEKTVKNYTSHLLAKLGLERRTQAAILATELRERTGRG